MSQLTAEETRTAIAHRYEHDRKKARLLVVFPALHDLPLEGPAAALSLGARVELPLDVVRPRLEQLAHALGSVYTHGRGDPEAIYQMVERSIALSVALDDFPDAAEAFKQALARALAHGQATYRAPDPRPTPETETDAARAALDHIYRFRRDEAQARKATAPKRAPGRPPKSDEIKAREAAVRYEFSRRRGAARAEFGRTVDALDMAEAQALRLVRQGVDVLAEPEAEPMPCNGCETGPCPVHGPDKAACEADALRAIGNARAHVAGYGGPDGPL